MLLGCLVLSLGCLATALLLVRIHPQPTAAEGVRTETAALSKTDTVTESAPPPSPVDAADAAMLDDIAKQYGAAGVSAAIIIDGRVALHYEYGMADPSAKTPMTADTKLRVASLSKPVLTMAAMQLCDEESLSLDSTMGELFGEGETWQDVTLRALLAHAAGINETNALANGGFPLLLNEELRKKDIFTARPFEVWAYSNLGYGIVGAAIEKTSGTLLSDCAEEGLFRPMGLDASWDGSHLAQPEQLAPCLRHNGSIALTAEYLARSHQSAPVGENYRYAAGGLLISAVDLGKLVTVLTGDGQYEGRQLLSPEAVRQIETPQDIDTQQPFRQCLCLRYAENCYAGHSMYFHPGNAYGVLALAAYDPQDKSGAVILTNGAADQKDPYGNYTVCTDMLEYLYKHMPNLGDCK